MLHRNARLVEAGRLILVQRGLPGDLDNIAAGTTLVELALAPNAGGVMATVGGAVVVTVRESGFAGLRYDHAEIRARYDDGVADRREEAGRVQGRRGVSPVDAVFDALGDPARRELRCRLAASGGARASAPAQERPVTCQARAKHSEEENGV
ncbi:hypothetical protein [Gryllotalpicola sp.]|uniref:hypothetical protein n=1 Tax=Gryllotalpicola sp. TaxID=1932787 RepID=UPI00261BBBD4|nr:hypothetical protein [Gryllotalpicola sp.]